MAGEFGWFHGCFLCVITTHGLGNNFNVVCSVQFGEFDMWMLLFAHQCAVCLCAARLFDSSRKSDAHSVRWYAGVLYTGSGGIEWK